MDDLISREEALKCLTTSRLFDETEEEMIATFTRRINQLPTIARVDIANLESTYERGFMDGFEAHRELIKKGRVKND